jgi:hypothetical protein
MTPGLAASRRRRMVAVLTIAGSIELLPRSSARMKEMRRMWLMSLRMPWWLE